MDAQDGQDGAGADLTTKSTKAGEGGTGGLPEYGKDGTGGASGTFPPAGGFMGGLMAGTPSVTPYPRGPEPLDLKNFPSQSELLRAAHNQRLADIWLAAWCATAGNGKCRDALTAGRWANQCVRDYQKLFTPAAQQLVFKPGKPGE